MKGGKKSKEKGREKGGEGRKEKKRGGGEKEILYAYLCAPRKMSDSIITKTATAATPRE